MIFRAAWCINDPNSGSKVLNGKYQCPNQANRDFHYESLQRLSVPAPDLLSLEERLGREGTEETFLRKCISAQSALSLTLRIPRGKVLPFTPGHFICMTFLLHHHTPIF